MYESCKFCTPHVIFVHFSPFRTSSEQKFVRFMQVYEFWIVIFVPHAQPRLTAGSRHMQDWQLFSRAAS